MKVVASGLPSGFGPAGATTKIFDSNMVAGVKRERRQIITLRQITQSQPLGPARLDAELLAPLGCDYALVSVPFGAYEQQSHIGALYGAIPLAGSKQLISLTPRGVYLLYDCKSGEPFDIYFPPGGVGAALTIGGEDFALREIETVAGKRFADEHFELYMKENGSADLTLDEKKIRSDCRQR